MFVEDSNKESETVKPRTSQEASAPATVAVPSPVVTSVPAPTIMASYQTGGTQDQRSESSWPWLSGTSSVSGTDEAVYPWWDYTSQSCFRFYSRHGSSDDEGCRSGIDWHLSGCKRGKAKLRMEKLRKETVEDKATNLRIEQLREELKTLTDKSIDLNSEIQKNTAETTAFEARTNATIDKVTNRLNEDKVRLTQIL